jgi:predicted RNA-binding Zn ribbon-like protein
LPGPLPNQWGVAPCLDLINSRWSDHLGSGRFYERLSEAVWRRGFLVQWGYRVRDPDDNGAIADLVALRTVLRGALELHMSGRRLPRSLRLALETQMNRAPTRLAMSSRPGGYDLSLLRLGDEWDAVIAEVATSAGRLISQRRRLKVCANPHCSWMFVDESRPGTRRWCDVSICGSLINVRRHRAVRGGR